MQTKPNKCVRRTNADSKQTHKKGSETIAIQSNALQVECKAHCVWLCHGFCILLDNFRSDNGRSGDHDERWAMDNTRRGTKQIERREENSNENDRNDHLLNSTLLFCAAIVLSPDAFEQYYYCCLWAATQPTISHPRETTFCCLRWAVSLLVGVCVCASWRCTANASTHNINLHGICLYFPLHLKKKKPAVNLLSEVNKSQYLLFSSLISRQRRLQLSVKLSIRAGCENAFSAHSWKL